MRRVFLLGPRDGENYASPPHDLAWHVLPKPAQRYVGAVIVGGTVALAAFLPLTFPRPILFAVLLLLACVTSAWKVNLPIPLSSSATLSASEAANFMALLLLGPHHAVVVAVAGVWAQCTLNVKRPYPRYRTLFSAAGEALTMVITGLVYGSLGGSPARFDVAGWAPPLVAAVTTCFVVNTGLVAGAIALSTSRAVWKVWRDDFQWSVVSFMVTGSAGAIAALVIDRGDYLKAALMLAPVYLTYRTYRTFVTRLEDEKTLTSGAVAFFSGQVREAQRQQQDAVEGLLEAREIERILIQEKERLATALVEMTHIEEAHTELLEREQAARANAEQANVAKDQFLATVSHELRTPLTAILGWADMLRHGVLDDAGRDRAGRAIYLGAQRQAELINELLDVARIMSRKLQLELTVVDLKDVMRGAVDIVQPNADAKRIDIGIEEDPSIGMVYGDSGRLHQVATNLLANAVKFTPEGGVIHVSLRRMDDFIEIAVADNGPGIPPDFLPSVFEPFKQADAATTRNHGGLGLGLSIVKHLVEAHGGTVHADSRGKGQGATFTVRLPVATVCGNQIESIAADLSSLHELEEETDELEGISVLVVDDDDESRLVIAAHLENHHARVLTAASAPAALDILQREQVDVLLADVAMPGEDGYSLIRKLRAATRTASIPAAALTAFARNEDRQRALEAGFQLHLAKPVDVRSLVAAVVKLGKPVHS